MSYEKFDSNEVDKSNKIAVIDKVANFFRVTKKLEREIESEPYATIIDFNPDLALELLKLGEDEPISRDAYAKGVADGVATIIELFGKQKNADIIQIERFIGKFAVSDKDIETN
jgi:hypothetical protein